ncbi:hypothetical protein [Streptomyces formicae]|uniref:Uncharacterized protein n=1 Tax=Streptomyces formicae TaxID=1616117 RepID=A0A291QI63_9ACTN|nr:hypothetical protein [Streptomyces formicae]ATL31248.1 hypothetical protein KY5_6230c [Streptomyces formicae]
MTELTTAQRLAAYRDELHEAQFPTPLVDALIRDAAHHPHHEDDGLTIAADLEDDNTPCTGVMHVRLVPHLERGAMAEALIEIQERALQAYPLGLHPHPAPRPSPGSPPMPTSAHHGQDATTRPRATASAQAGGPPSSARSPRTITAVAIDAGPTRRTPDPTTTRSSSTTSSRSAKVDHQL